MYRDNSSSLTTKCICRQVARTRSSRCQKNIFLVANSLLRSFLVLIQSICSIKASSWNSVSTKGQNLDSMYSHLCSKLKCSCILAQAIKLTPDFVKPQKTLTKSQWIHENGWHGTYAQQNILSDSPFWFNNQGGRNYRQMQYFWSTAWMSTFDLKTQYGHATSVCWRETLYGDVKIEKLVHELNVIILQCKDRMAQMRLITKPVIISGHGGKQQSQVTLLFEFHTKKQEWSWSQLHHSHVRAHWNYSILFIDLLNTLSPYSKAHRSAPLPEFYFSWLTWLSR